jgi:hypothetical protein
MPGSLFRRRTPTRGGADGGHRLPGPRAAAGDATSRHLRAHYERRGDRVLKLLGQELFDDTFRERMDLGRRLHREQIAELFAPQLTERPTADYEALIDLLVVATDVYTWKLLRRDRRLDRPTAEERMRQLIAGILRATTEGV